MSNRNGHGKMPPGAIPMLPPNVAATATITAYHDRNPTVTCSGGIMALFHLLRIGLTTAIKDLEAKQAQEAADKKAKDGTDQIEFKFMGPRETINYGPDVGKK